MTQAQNQAVTEISRQLVKQVAPRELPLYRAVSGAWLKDPGSLQSGTGFSNKTLGFGGSEIVEILTPAVLSVVSAVVATTVKELAPAVLKYWQNKTTQNPAAAIYQSGDDILHDRKESDGLRSHLRRFMEHSFDLDELQTICFDSAIDYENVAGTTKQAKIVALILIFERQGRTQELLRICKEQRPHNYDRFLASYQSNHTLTAEQLSILAAAGAKAAAELNISREDTDKIVSALINSMAMA